MTSFTVTEADFTEGIPIAGPGPVNTVNKYYCATDSAAGRFITHLKNLGIGNCQLSEDWPLGTFAPGSPFQQGQKVPFVDFINTDGNVIDHENVGQCILEYLHYPQNFCDNLMVQWFGQS